MGGAEGGGGHVYFIPQTIGYSSFVQHVDCAYNVSSYNIDISICRLTDGSQIQSNRLLDV